MQVKAACDALHSTPAAAGPTWLPWHTHQAPTCASHLPTLQVPLSRIAELNKPELPAAVTGLAGSAALGMMMPGFAIAFSSMLGVFYGPGECSTTAQLR